jgi:hypothetical protein
MCAEDAHGRGGLYCWMFVAAIDCRGARRVCGRSSRPVADSAGDGGDHCIDPAATYRCQPNYGRWVGAQRRGDGQLVCIGRPAMGITALVGHYSLT